jgi:thioredoxin reductase (NADPH)
MTGEDVYVVGGANSAGQAAIHLARFARRVTILVRGPSLTESMSDYLVREIEATGNIAVRYRSEVVDGAGTGRLTTLVVRDRTTGSTETVPAGGLFVLIGAVPHTEWLPDEIVRDEAGYIRTGGSARQFETSMPGVFAVGDVRSGSVKRVASSVGDGAVVIRLVHEYLDDLHTK